MKKQKRKNAVIFAVGILVVLLVALGLVFLQGNKNLLDPQQITSVLLTEESGIEQKLDPQQTEQLAQMVNVALKQKGSDFSGEQAKVTAIVTQNGQEQTELAFDEKQLFYVGKTYPFPQEEVQIAADFVTHFEEEKQKLEEEHKAEEAKKAEEQRKAEEAKKAEEQRKAEEAKKAEEQRKAEEAKKAEEQRKAEEAKKAEEQRKAEEAKKAEEQRKAEEAKEAEEQRKAQAATPESAAETSDEGNANSSGNLGEEDNIIAYEPSAPDDVDEPQDSSSEDEEIYIVDNFGNIEKIEPSGKPSYSPPKPPPNRKEK